MRPYRVIEPARGATYDHYRDAGEYAVYEYGEYEPSSVLAGQTRRSYIAGGYASAQAAQADYPDAEIAPQF